MRSRNKITLALVLCFITIGTSAYIANVLFVPTISDVLIVQVGEDDNVEKTANLISDNLKNRNDEMTKFNEENKKSEYKKTILDTLYSTSIMELGSINKILTLDINVVHMSIEDLETGKINEYNTKILIIVGHGSVNGLTDGQDEMKWNEVSDLLKEGSASFSILTSCHSALATEKLENAFGFQGVVDGIVAGYITSALIFRMLGDDNLAIDAMESALSRYNDILNNPELFIPLEITWDEILHWIVMVVIGIIQNVLLWDLPDFLDNFLFNFVAKFLLGGFIELAWAIVDLILGNMSGWDFAIFMIGFVFEVLGALISAILALFASNFWYALFLWIVFGLTLVAHAATGGLSLLGNILGVIGTIISIGITIYNDVID